MNSIWGNFRRLNTITGWILFFISSSVYLMTLEPTVSFWDCGEFILSSFRLQVGHPPGAPLFLMIGRIATLFAGGDTSKVAMMMNALSALCSGFAIMFLFWTITHLVRKVYSGSNAVDSRHIPAILGSGIIGALAYTFSDTFWFSAVEGELYALSSLVTGLVFWGMLKWEEEAHNPYVRPFLDAANIDLKGYTDDFYKSVCGARLQPVLDAIRLYKELGIWIEITTLVIPGHNDSDDELKQIADFIQDLGSDVPWHVSRFHPTYKLIDQPRTPLETLKRARQIGLDARLRYVYEGNIPGEGEETICWNCGRSVVKRFGFTVEGIRVSEGKCVFCGAKIDGV